MDSYNGSILHPFIHPLSQHPPSPAVLSMTAPTHPIPALLTRRALQCSHPLYHHLPPHCCLISPPSPAVLSSAGSTPSFGATVTVNGPPSATEATSLRMGCRRARPDWARAWGREGEGWGEVDG